MRPAREHACSVLALLLVGCATAPAQPPPRACPAAPPCTAKAAAPKPVAAPAPAPVPDVDGMKDKVVALINARNGSGLYDLFAPIMKKALPRPKAQTFVEGVLAARGPLVSANRTPGDTNTHDGKFLVKAKRGTWQLALHVDDQDRIDGMYIRDAPAPDHPVVQSSIALRMPFHGRWEVSWGGPTELVNHHVNQKSQRRAADLVIVGKDGRTYTGEGDKNTDYHAFGQPVLAVADGKVVTVVDGVPENHPGDMNPYFLTGNVVVVQHTPKLYSVYAHLEPGRIRVKPGMKVHAGQVLGLCGNTGNSSEPHLHFQLQDGPSLAQSFGVEALFHDVDVTRDGKKSKMPDYTFLKGDLIDAK